MRRHWIGGAIATGAAGLALAGAALGAGTAGAEHFTFLSTSVSADRFSVIATGVFTAGGTATPLAGTDTLKFPNGTIDVTSKSTGKPVTTGNTKTCYESLSQRGTYTLAGGTGTYAGITGSGSFTLSIRQVGPVTNGKCDTKTSKRVASQGIITASGPVSLG